MFFQLPCLTRLPWGRKAVGEVIEIMLLFFGSISVVPGRRLSQISLPFYGCNQCEPAKIA